MFFLNLTFPVFIALPPSLPWLYFYDYGGVPPWLANASMNSRFGNSCPPWVYSSKSSLSRIFFFFYRQFFFILSFIACDGVEYTRSRRLHKSIIIINTNVISVIIHTNFRDQHRLQRSTTCTRTTASCVVCSRTSATHFARH